MFKGIKILFRLIFAPTKLILSNSFGVKKNTPTMLKPLKYALMFIGGALTLALFISVTVKGVNHFEGNRYVKPYVKLADGTPLKEENPDGTINGLNLLLIDSIQTEGYVKDILTLYRDSYEGKLDDHEVHLSVDGAIGIQINETGAYPGTYLPKSYLPMIDNEVKWKTSVNSIPSENMTVRNLSPSEAINLVLSYPDSYGGLSSNLSSNSGYQGLYQNGDLNVNGFGPSKVNYNGSSSSREGYTFYQPDGLAYLNGRASRFYANYLGEAGDSIKHDGQIISIITAGTHNAGEGGFLSPLVYGSSWNKIGRYDSESSVMALVNLRDDLKLGVDKNPRVLSYPFGSGPSRLVGAYLLCESGWNLSPVGLRYIETQYVDDSIASAIMGDGSTSEDLMNYFKSKVGKLPISDSEASTLYGWYNSSESWSFESEYGSSIMKGFLFKYDSSKKVKLVDGTERPFLSVIQNEALGQIYSAAYGGSYYYSAALKYAGVDVDPTNPSTYMNSLPEGEWNPSGNSEWMGEFNINPIEIGAKRTSFLNEAHKWIGSWYAWGGNQPPEKDSNGEWIQPTLQPNGWSYEKGFDCSSFIQYSLKTALNIDISRTTWSQRANANTYVISASEVKPGDLVYYWGADLDWGHVSIYIGKDSNGKVNYLHSPVPGQRIGFTTWNGQPEYSILEYRRVKGLD